MIGVSGGAIAGAAGAVLGSPILAAGNYLAFGDKYSWKRYGIDIVAGGIIGGIAGGISAAMANRAARAAGDVDNIRDIWTGKIKPTGVGANARHGWNEWGTTELDAESSIGKSVTAHAEKTTTVGRWMSRAEYDMMKSTGRVLPGAGGKTSVSVGGSDSFKAAAKGSVYVEFDVPTSSLLQGGQSGWYSILSSDASKSLLYVLQKQGGQVLPLIQNLSPIIKVK